MTYGPKSKFWEAEYSSKCTKPHSARQAHSENRLRQNMFNAFTELGAICNDRLDMLKKSLEFSVGTDSCQNHILVAAELRKHLHRLAICCADVPSGHLDVNQSGLTKHAHQAEPVDL